MKKNHQRASRKCCRRGNRNERRKITNDFSEAWNKKRIKEKSPRVKRKQYS